MPAPRKRSAADLSKELEARAEQAEIERIDALSDEELDRELREAGVDPAFAEQIPYFLPAPLEDRADEGGEAEGSGLGPLGSEPARRVWPWVAALVVLVITVAAIAMRR